MSPDYNFIDHVTIKSVSFYFTGLTQFITTWIFHGVKRLWETRHLHIFKPTIDQRLPSLRMWLT